MEEEQFEEEEEVHGLEDKGSAPFLTRAAYEESLSKGTTHELVAPVEEQAYQQQVPPSSKSLSSKPAQLPMTMQICKWTSLLLSPAR